MKLVRGIVCVAALLVCLTTPVSAQENCATVAQAEAFAVRDLQSRLLVGALGCGQRTAYNAFVKRHEHALARAGQNLIAYFKATGRSTRAIDTHVTRAANAAAVRHAEDQNRFCARSAALFTELLSSAAVSLKDIAYKATLEAVRKPQACIVAADNTPAEHPLGVPAPIMAHTE